MLPPDAFKKLEDLNITQEESQKLEKAFKNEEFRRMFAEYMKEISDPENRKLYEEEIRKAEAERGNDVSFITPEPQFCVKLHSKSDNQKIFINIGQSTQVERPVSEFDKKTGKGYHWSIPYSTIPARDDADKAGNLCKVYDIIYHPEAFTLGKKDPRFHKMLIETAMEGVETRFQVKLVPEYKIMKFSYKGVPKASIIRNSVTDTDAASPLSPAVSTPASKTPTKSTGAPDMTTFLDQLKKDVVLDRKVSPSSPSNPVVPLPSSSLISEISDEAVKDDDDKNLEIKTVKEATPKFQIVHRGQIQMSDFTCERERQGTSRPTSLVIRIEIPRTANATEIQLDITERHLDLRVPRKYALKTDIPFPVNPDRAEVNFFKGKGQLVVVLPVLPPPVIHLPQSDVPIDNSEEEEKAEKETTSASLVQDITPPLPSPPSLYPSPPHSTDPLSESKIQTEAQSNLPTDEVNHQSGDNSSSPATLPETSSPKMGNTATEEKEVSAPLKDQKVQKPQTTHTLPKENKPPVQPIVLENSLLYELDGLE